MWYFEHPSQKIFMAQNSNLRIIQIVFIAVNVIFRVSSSKKNFVTPFRFNCLKSTEPLQGGIFLFLTQFREISGTNLINLGRMKGWFDLGATPSLWKQGHWTGNPAPEPIDQFLFFHCWYSMKTRYVIWGKPTLLTIKNTINYFVCVGSCGIFQGSALKTVFSVLFFLKCIKKKHFRSTWAEQFCLVLFLSFTVFL